MQLDRTHLKIRTRSISELGDLALVMLRRYPGAFGVAFLFGALPWILINYALLAWIPIREAQIGLNDQEAIPELMRYGFWMATLVFLETPIAGAATTYYLGQAVFEEKPTYRAVWTACRKRFWTWFWVLGWVRFPMIAVVLLLFRIGSPANGFVDGFLPFCFWLPALAVRASRPFMPEILLLEQCPLKAKQPGGLTAAIRSSRLHVPLSAELNGRFMVIGIVIVLLAASVYYTLSSTASLLSGNAVAGTLWPLLVFYPLALWLVAGLSVLVRLLNYLDSRIRLEGWDVELAVRAEQMRQFGVPEIAEPNPSVTEKPKTKRLKRSTVKAKTVAGAALAAICLTFGGGAVAAQEGEPLLEDSVWFDAGSGSTKAIPVSDSNRDSVNRHSRWLPKPKRIKKAAKTNPTTTTGANTTTGGGGGGGGGSFFGTGLSFGNLLGWALVMICIAAICALLYVMISKFEPSDAGTSTAPKRRAARAPDEQTLERIAALPPELRRTDVDMRTEAERLMSEGRYDLAIILLFGHQLLTLDRAGLIRLNRGKTNRRYLRECRNADRDAAKALHSTVELFERSFFGGHAIESHQFRSVWLANRDLEKIAEHRSGVAA